MRSIPRQDAIQGVGRTAGTAALVVSLLVGARLMALAVGSDGYAWLGWFSLVPLFLVIRLWRPARAMLAGALWGISLCLFSVGQLAPPVGVPSLLLLAAAPAIYAYFGARLTRWIGFNPFVLGVAWMGVELAIHPVGLRTGLLGGADGGPVLHWVGQALGCALAAFLVALVNALLVSLLSSARLSIPQPRRQSPPGYDGALCCPQVFFFVPRFSIRPSCPRAPPA